MNLLVPAKPTREAPNAVALAIPLPPLPAGTGHDATGAESPVKIPLPEPVKPIGVQFDKDEKLVTAGSINPIKDVVVIFCDARLTKRKLYAYLYAFTGTAGDLFLKAVIHLFRDNSLVATLPLEVGSAGITTLTGQSPICCVAQSGGFGVDNLQIFPISPISGEAQIVFVAPLNFRADIDRVAVDFVTAKNVEKFRCIIACVSTS